MSGYDTDPRVEKVNNHLYWVCDDDKYFGEEVTSGRWFTAPALDSRQGREAQRLSRQEREDWAERMTVGPFPSRDAAIASLIGAPR